MREEYQDLLALLEEKFDSLTDKQKKIRRFVLENLEHVSFMSAREIAQEVGVSESTVTRFAHSLSFDGYADFQKALQDRLAEKITTADKLSAIEGREEKKSVLEKVTERNISHIKGIKSRVEKGKFEQAVNMFLSSKNIFIIGLRTSFTVAYLMHYELSVYTLKNSILLGVRSEKLVDKLVDLKEEDLLLAISLPRYTKETVKVLEYANHENVSTISITDSLASPLVPHSNVCFTASAEGLSVSDSLAPSITIAQALVEAVTLHQIEEVQQRLEKKEELWSKLDTFYEESF